MKAIRTIAKPSTLDALEWIDIADAPAPARGEITVGLKATSLNYHDYAVVTGMIPTTANRIPMSDGAGVTTYDQRHSLSGREFKVRYDICAKVYRLTASFRSNLYNFHRGRLASKALGFRYLHNNSLHCILTAT